MSRARDMFDADDPLRELFTPVNCYALVHSFCTTLLVDGEADITTVQKARGHRDVRTTQIYTTMKVDPRLKVGMSRAFGTLISGSPSKAQAS